MKEYLIFGGVALVIIAVVIYTVIRNNKIRKNGVEADAVVSRIEEEWTTSSEGGADFSEIYYVTYVNQEGKSVEARLENAPGRTREGDRVRIKYLPEKPHFAIWVK